MSCRGGLSSACVNMCKMCKKETKKEKRGICYMPKSYRTCEIVQQLEYLTEDQIEKGLDHNAVKDYAYILHDKDENKDGELKKPHWHICIRFKDSVPTESICNWFGITENYINKIRGRFGDALAYLTHKNATEKYQYLEESVKSNFDFKKEAEIKQGREADKARKAELVDLITGGVIREYNYTEYITPQEYDKFKKTIDNAFNYRRDKLEGSDRNMKCIYVCGDAGTGKTTWAKDFAQRNKYSYYISSGSNDLLDNYKGQDCLILDDIRPNYIDVSDLLKLLDNHTNSTVKSRYKNKMLECKVVIITTSLTMEVFFRNLIGDSRENLKQMRRRCEMYIMMTNLTMSVKLWQSQSEDYMQVGVYDNPVANKYLKHDRTLEEAREYVDNMILFPVCADNETISNAYGFTEMKDSEDVFTGQLTLPV